jgi:hypothetical protein
VIGVLTRVPGFSHDGGARVGSRFGCFLRYRKVGIEFLRVAGNTVNTITSTSAPGPRAS